MSKWLLTQIINPNIHAYAVISIFLIGERSWSVCGRLQLSSTGRLTDIWRVLGCWSSEEWSLPPFWPGRFSALSSSKYPLAVKFNGVPARVYLSVSCFSHKLTSFVWSGFFTTIIICFRCMFCNNFIQPVHISTYSLAFVLADFHLFIFL